MRRIVTIAAVAAAALVAVVGLFWTAQRRLIYFPTQAVGDVSPSFEDVTFATDDGLILSAWWVPASGGPDGSTIVVFPGNGGNRQDRVPLAQGLAARGFDVLLVDYRGYGGNPGNPSETGLLLDAVAAVDYLESRPDINADRLVYFGESLGAAVAIAVAHNRPPSALILRSPFTSLPDVAKTHYPYLPTGLLLRDRFPSIDTISRVDVPVLVIAGTEDSIVPFDQSREIYEAAPGPKRFVTIQGADHNDAALTHGPGVVDAVTDFLKDLEASS